jgi:hypothetical protein
MEANMTKPLTRLITRSFLLLGLLGLAACGGGGNGSATDNNPPGGTNNPPGGTNNPPAVPILTAANDAYAWLGNSRITVPAANGVLANDTLASGVVPVQMASTQGGTVNITADGGFTYEPPLNVATGIDTFTYSATDASGATVTGTVNITINGVARYVKNDFVGTSTGSSTAPFTTLTAAMALAGPGDTIFVFTGNPATVYNGRINLLANQRLIGQGLGLTFDVLPADPNNLPLPIAGVATTTALATTPPVLTHTAVFPGNLPMLALANNVEVAGVVIDGATAVSNLIGMLGAGITGFNIHDNTIRNLPKAAIQFSGATGGVGMIVGNTITNIAGVAPDNAIDIVTIGAGVDFSLTGNTLNNVLDSGIRVQFPGGGKVAVTNNTLTNIGTAVNRRGIDVDGAGTAVISGNTVDNSAAGVAAISRSGIQVNASGNLKASVTGNTIKNATPADGGIQAQTTIPASLLCLRMTGNTTANGFILDNRNTGNLPASFRIEGGALGIRADFEAANTNTGLFTYLLTPAAVSFVPVGTCGFVP